jgi:hypothetical protein
MNLHLTHLISTAFSSDNALFTTKRKDIGDMQNNLHEQEWRMREC